MQLKLGIKEKFSGFFWREIGIYFLNIQMDDEEEEEEAMTEQEVKNSSLENIYNGNCLEKVNITLDRS